MISDDDQNKPGDDKVSVSFSFEAAFFGRLDEAGSIVDAAPIGDTSLDAVALPDKALKESFTFDLNRWAASFVLSGA